MHYTFVLFVCEQFQVFRLRLLTSFISSRPIWRICEQIVTHHCSSNYTANINKLHKMVENKLVWKFQGSQTYIANTAYINNFILLSVLLQLLSLFLNTIFLS